MNIDYPLLIDGGLSNELQRQGHDLNHRLWTAKLLAGNPEAIVLAHLAYLEAGARCITTASYQASLAGLVEAGIDPAGAEALLLKSAQLAEEAARRFIAAGPGRDRPLVAASIGPYGAYLADGSEYRGEYGLSDRELGEFHLPRLRLLDGSNADLLACETIPSFPEARVLAGLLRDTAKPAWVSFSCRDERHISDGTPIEECAALFSGHPGVFAIGVNCTAPKHISALIGVLKGVVQDQKIVVYPNSGEVYRPDTKTWVGLSDPHSYAELAAQWLAGGADIIGGCCRIGPGHIRELDRLLTQQAPA